MKIERKQATICRMQLKQHFEGNLVVLITYIRKEERSHINDLNLHIEKHDFKRIKTLIREGTLPNLNKLSQETEKERALPAHSMRPALSRYQNLQRCDKKNID